MWQIEQTKAPKLRHVNLGHWIERSPKMAHKAQFQPHQLLVDGQWVAALGQSAWRAQEPAGDKIE